MEWTDKQKQVIETRGCNLLVSAAAGSGKTAVLVERILRLISEGENPLDIDRLLVMTFTNAAAAEMRERIALAIGQRLEQEPQNEHLQTQAALAPHAQITTIDSFCLSLIRDHFNLLDIDPAFRIGDEGELLLLRADVMERMLEEYYENADPDFAQFVDTYAVGKSDSGIEDYIMQVYTFAQSNPFPEEWFEDCQRELEQMTEGNLEQTRWMEFLMADARSRFREMAGQYGEALRLCQEEDGPQAYLPTFYEERQMLERLASAADYESLCRELEQAAFGRLKAARGKDLDPDKKEQAAECRNRVKKAVTELKEAYAGQTPEEALSDILAGRQVVRKLLELAEEFSRRYQEAKRDKNLVDFNDLEHYALQILIDRTERGELRYTETADQLSGRYAEILVDEYQDSNYVQEALIRSLSGERFGRPNVFMVGDVKQSIYRFRLARPELFMEKYDAYSDGSAAGRKIELHQNFRSRASVLDSVNAVFYQIMTRNLGNVDYTEETALHPGAFFPEPGSGESADGQAGGRPEEQNGSENAAGEAVPGRSGEQTDGRAEGQSEEQNGGEEVPGEAVPGRSGEQTDGRAEGRPEEQNGEAASGRTDYRTELLLLDVGKETMGVLEDEAADYTARELEAKLIAGRIRQLTDPQKGLLLWDKDGKRFRKARCGDMVILLRSMEGWSETFVQVLTREGIPAYAETGTGYFNTVEVETVLAMLAVIDNPIQDIPLAAVLHSPMAGLEDEELARMMADFKKTAEKGRDRGIWGAFCHMIEKGAADGGKGCGFYDKLKRFQELLEELRFQATYLPIHELLDLVYERTGYYDYVSAMPAGETRRANLDMLIEKASAYERTSCKGLFQFIRYIGQLKKYETDFGEASAGKYENMVRIMSIHKSKGLEFPIVFLPALGKRFNKQEVRGKLLIDSDLGIAADYLDLERRTRSATLKKQVLKRKLEMDGLGEELRVLYVGMTRAKEKLILTGADRSLAKKLEKWSHTVWGGEENGRPAPVPCTALLAAGSCLDWILMTHPETSPFFRSRIVPPETLVGEEVLRQVQKKASRAELPTRREAAEEAAQAEEAPFAGFRYRYPYEAEVKLHTKMTVSELKKLGQEEDDFQGLQQPAVPDFLRKTRDAEEKQAAMEHAAARGTAMHRILELLDFRKAETEEEVREQIGELRARYRIGEETEKLARPEWIWRLAVSPLGRRMKQAQENGALYREKQFVMGLPAREMGLGDSEELVLIQGIIDAYLVEDGKLVLIDYKTDRLEPGQEELLVRRYQVQLDYYQKALEQMVKLPVKEKLIYSLALQEAIQV